MASLNDLVYFLLCFFVFWPFNLIWLRFNGAPNGFVSVTIWMDTFQNWTRNQKSERLLWAQHMHCIDSYLFYSGKIQCHRDECICDSEMLQFQSNAVNSQRINRYWHFWFVLLFVCTIVSFRFVWHLLGFVWTILSRQTQTHTWSEREIKMYGEWKILYWWPSIRTNWKRKIALQQFRPMIAMIYDNEATILLPLISENCVLEPFAVWICDVLMCDAMPCHATAQPMLKESFSFYGRNGNKDGIFSCRCQSFGNFYAFLLVSDFPA